MKTLLGIMRSNHYMQAEVDDKHANERPGIDWLQHGCLLRRKRTLHLRLDVPAHSGNDCKPKALAMGERKMLCKTLNVLLLFGHIDLTFADTTRQVQDKLVAWKINRA